MRLVLILKSIRLPRLTLMSVAKPSIFELPAPSMSHSLCGFPGFWFSRTIGFVEVAGAARGIADCVVLIHPVVPVDPVVLVEPPGSMFEPVLVAPVGPVESVAMLPGRVLPGSMFEPVGVDSVVLVDFVVVGGRPPGEIRAVVTEPESFPIWVC